MFSGDLRRRLACLIVGCVKVVSEVPRVLCVLYRGVRGGEVSRIARSKLAWFCGTLVSILINL